jgi:hypothetical protein
MVIRHAARLLLPAAALASAAVGGCTTTSGGTPASAAAASLPPAYVHLTPSPGPFSVVTEAPAATPGAVIWRQTGGAVPPPPSVSQQLSQINQNLTQLQGQTSAELAALEQRLRAQQQAHTVALEKSTLGTVQQVATMANNMSTAAQEAERRAKTYTAKQLAQLRQQQLTPEQVAQLTQATLTNPTPQVQAALSQAARNVIMKDNKVVFAIRRVLAGQVGAASNSSNTAYIHLGNDRLAPDTVQLDANRLKIAALQAPGQGADNLSLEQLAALQPASGPMPTAAPLVSTAPAVSRESNLPGEANKYIDIRTYKVIAHTENQTLEELLAGVVNRASKAAGPWQLKWKISPENQDLLTERFSLDVETNFEDFVAYIAQYIVNERGVKLSFNLFDSERIIVIAD